MRAIESRIVKLEEHGAPPSRGRLFILKGRCHRSDAEVAAFLKTKDIELQANDTTFDLAFIRAGTMERVDVELELVEAIPVRRTHEQALADADAFNRKIEEMAARATGHSHG